MSLNPTSARSALRQLADSAKTVVWMADPNGICTYLNPSVALFLESPADLRVSDWTSFIHPDDRLRLRPFFKKVKEKQEEYEVEYRIVKSDGTVRWMTSSGAPRFSDTGEFIGYVGAISDSTSRHEALIQLAKSEEAHRLLTESSSDLISHHAADSGNYLYASPSSKRIIGFMPSELIGTSCYDSFHPDDVALVRAEIRRQAMGEKGQLIEFRVRHKAGHYIWIGAKASVLLDHISGEKLGAVVVSRDITAERQAREELQRSRDRMSAMLESIGDAFFALDHNWRLTYVNQRTADFVKRKREDLVGRILWEAVPEILESPFFTRYQYAMETGQPVSFESYWKPASAWCDIRIHPNEEGISVYFHDITARRDADNAIRASEERFRKVIEMTPAGYILTDANGILLDVNPAICSISGYGRDELVGMNMMKLLPTCPLDGALFKKGGATAAHGKESVIRHKDGYLAYVLINVSIPRDSEGNALSLTAFVTDITDRKQAEICLEELATHDTLTGLPNRTHMNQRLQQMVAMAQAGESIAVMFIDLDRFKEVNDSMGHAIGDVLLRTVSSRLQKIMRPNDVIARLGGDEFIAAAYCSQGKDSAAAIAEKLLAALAAPFEIEGQHVYVSASIGISMFPEDGNKNDLLFQNADTAMYRAKAAGRNGYRFFESEMSQEAKRRMALEQALRHALEHNEFELYYQPRIDLKSMVAIGMEVLIRWNHSELGSVPPSQFIPMAEDRNFIEPIGQWVLEEACKQTRHWIDKFGQPLRVSVNMSARQLKSHDLVERVKNVLERTRLPSHLLELELTETTLIEDMELSTSILKELKAIGVRLSVDDFGTGYSALSHLRRFPLDVLKLDRTFLNRDSEGVGSLEFIRAFIDMTHALNLSVVAEGVEDKETAWLLQDFSCDAAQGYLFSKPLPAHEFEEYLSQCRLSELEKVRLLAGNSRDRQA